MSLPEWYTSCDKCREHADAQPLLLEAFSSVGIETGKSTWEMAEDYFENFHKNGHEAQP